MEKLLQTGKVKAIGVANFSVPYLEELLSKTDIVPAANQIENHPLLPQQEVVDYCIEKGIHVTAYSPLGSTGSPLMQEEEILKVAKKHNVGPGTVLLSYHCEFSLFSSQVDADGPQWLEAVLCSRNLSRCLASMRIRH
jgi:glycerol 2-dehydrogenase (NADP+)